MKILVTGGAGFIGSNFVRRTLEDAYPGLEGAEVVVLDALGAVLRGEDEGGDAEPMPEWGEGGGSPHTPEVRSPEFEVMFLLDGLDEEGADRLRGRLERIGDSVLVAGDTDLRTVHVHTDEPGLAVEAGMSVGRPYGVRLSRLCEPGAECDPPGVPAAAALGVVACVQAPGLVPVFEEHGAVVLLDAPGRRVTPAQFLEAARRTGAHRVAVLPDDGDAVLAASAAQQIAAEEGIELVVVPTSHQLQGLAALAVVDLGDPDCVPGMASAAAAVRCGFVATATASAITDAGPCRPGGRIGPDAALRRRSGQGRGHADPGEDGPDHQRRSHRHPQPRPRARARTGG